MLGLYREHYANFTVKHFHEQLVKRHHYTLGYTVTKLHLHHAGLVKPAPRRSAHRKKRPRRPLPGMLLHQDASRHGWLDGAPPLDLVVTLETPHRVYSAFLVEEEGTASSFRGLAEVVASKGLFCALYTDRGSHFFHTRRPAAGCRAPSSPRSAGRSRSSASSTSPPIRRRPAAARSGSSGRCRTGCRRHSRLAGITGHRDRQPLARRGLSARAQRSLRGAGGAGRLRLRRLSKSAAGARSSASRKSASSATTTPSNGSGSPCRSRRRRCDPLRTHKVRVHQYRIATRCSGPHRSPIMMPKIDHSPCAGRLSRFGRQTGCGLVDIASSGVAP